MRRLSLLLVVAAFGCQPRSPDQTLSLVAESAQLSPPVACQVLDDVIATVSLAGDAGATPPAAGLSPVWNAVMLRGTPEQLAQPMRIDVTASCDGQPLLVGEAQITPNRFDVEAGRIELIGFDGMDRLELRLDGERQPGVAEFRGPRAGSVVTGSGTPSSDGTPSSGGDSGAGANDPGYLPDPVASGDDPGANGVDPGWAGDPGSSGSVDDGSGDDASSDGSDGGDDGSDGSERHHRRRAGTRFARYHQVRRPLD